MNVVFTQDENGDTVYVNLSAVRQATFSKDKNGEVKSASLMFSVDHTMNFFNPMAAKALKGEFDSIMNKSTLDRQRA